MNPFQMWSSQDYFICVYFLTFGMKAKLLTYTHTQAFIYKPCKLDATCWPAQQSDEIVSVCYHLVVNFGTAAAVWLTNVNRHTWASTHTHRRQIKPLSLQMKEEREWLLTFSAAFNLSFSRLLSRFPYIPPFSPSSPLHLLSLHLFFSLLCVFSASLPPGVPPPLLLPPTIFLYFLLLFIFTFLSIISSLS